MVFKPIDSYSGILRTKSAILHPFQNAWYWNATRRRPQGIICPLWVHLHNTHTSQYNRHLSALARQKSTGPFPKCSCGGVLFLSLTHSLQASSSLSSPAPGSCSRLPLRAKQREALCPLFPSLHRCCRKGGPLPGPGVGSCLTVRNESREETHVLIKQETFWEEEPGWRAAGWGNPGGLLCHSLGFSGRVGFRSSLANHPDSGSLLVACTTLCQDGFQWEGFWEVGRTYGLESPLSFWAFPNYSGWW